MKVIFWNIRGIANTPSRLALKRLILLNNPDFIFIAEPWINYDSFPQTWFSRLGFKLFACNSRQNNHPNLWCLCTFNLNPDIVASTSQHVSLTYTSNSNTFGISAVYASTSYLQRKILWNDLINCHNLLSIPWCTLGDFNAIIGAHEHRGATPPAPISMNDFLNWSNNDNFIHLPTRGVHFTWANERHGRRYTERRLDRALCNNQMLDICSSISVSTLTKQRSDHYPILLDMQMNEDHHPHQFKFFKMWTLHADCRNVVEACWNVRQVGCAMFVLSQKLKSLKSALKSWNKDVFGNVHELVRDAEAQLHLIQNQIDTSGHSDTLLEQQKIAQLNLDNALAKEECFWKEKANVKWHVEGDRNTSFFHRTAKIKAKTNKITFMKDGDQILTEPELINNHITNHFTNLFCVSSVLQDTNLVDEVIPALVTEPVNNMLTLIPSMEETYNAVFNLNKEGAPGPDGFGAIFFQTYWDIVKMDVHNAVKEFFITSWMMPNYNANNLILIPKSSNADTVSQYRPIALANFKYKIVSKILADRLASIMPSIISPEQKGFIQGRQIKDCICLASEVINQLDKKTYGGNLAFKIDMAKAFDTLEWPYLLKVLHAFGFNNTFCNWIKVILESATLSISINGSQNGYFNCKRGVRQGDPLSPLLFCIAEDVLSRAITHLVEKGKVSLISSSRHHNFPSHVLYADDVMVFCKGNIASVNALKDLFWTYATASGQHINPAKSTIYAGSISQGRLNYLVNYLGFQAGELPFNYLGVPLFRGKPKKSHLQGIADKIKIKLASWKAVLLSMAGRVLLVKSVIQAMLVHSMSVYSWPIALLKDIDKWCRNFIWSGDIDKRKMVTVAWKKLCKPMDEGGMGLRSTISLNEASNLKLGWDMLNSMEPWATALRGRVFRNRKPIAYHIHSSLWCSIKSEFSQIIENSSWLLGNGKKINFWSDSWCGSTIGERLSIPNHILSHLSARVNDLIIGHQWFIPPTLQELFPQLYLILDQISIPIVPLEDELVWKSTSAGSLSLKEAYLYKVQVGQKIHWAKIIWSPDIPPSKSMMVWRLMHDRLPTDEKMMERGSNMVSMCTNCKTYTESSSHLFLHCPFASKLWNWLSSVLNFPINFTVTSDIWNVCDRSWTPQCKLAITACLVNVINCIWYVRNQARFQNKIIDWRIAINIIISSTALSGNNTTKTSAVDMTEFRILKALKINIHPPKAPSIKEVLWQPPIINWLKVNTDGAVTKNPSKAACGGIFRSSEGFTRGCFAQNLSTDSAFVAEILGAILAIEIAQSKNWNHVWLETDSKLLTLAFKNHKMIPWNLRNRWINCIEATKQMNFMVSHIYREGNVCADALANIGLNIIGFAWWQEAPSNIRKEVVNNMLGMPNYRYTTF